LPLPPPSPSPTPVAPLPPPLTRWPERVLFIGDSLSVGAAPVFKQKLLQRGVKAFDNVGVIGSTTPQWARGKHTPALDKALREFKPDLVLISLGTNDESGRRPRYSGPTYDVAKATAASVAALKAKIKAAGATSVWLGPPAVTPDLWVMDPNFRKLLADTWKSLYFSSEQLPFKKVKDKIHLTSADNTLWADSFIRWMESGGTPTS
jgi:lysophospholipase L1-like esterase